MTLAPGQRVGPYEVVALLGAGGMGEVYRVTDTRLGRTVAVKVLPHHLAGDPQRRERFEREARAVSSLNHPHICTLHDIGEQDGLHYLVMEYVEGETLAARLDRGRLPLDQALAYAIQIADALDKAHGQGVVHRDLKPGNVMVTKAGVKLLDFGLAKLKEAGAVPALSKLPTVAPSAPLTAEGTILGTLQYMAPEQLEGRDADPRTDIFAFGAVVYEMVTGRKAFQGTSQASLIAAIMNADPPPASSLEPLVPSLLNATVRTCLAKDPEERWHHAGDLARQLALVKEGAGAFAGGESTAGRVAPPPMRVRAARFLLAGMGGALIAGLIAWGLVRPEPARVMWTALPWSPEAELSVEGSGRDLAIMPDGTRIVHTGHDGTRLYLRPLDGLDHVELVAASGSIHGVFVSPDGEWIGFVEGTNTLKKVASSGGPPLTLLTMDGNALGAAWAEDDSIVFATANPTTGLQRVAAGGGPVDVLTRPDRDRGEANHLWPEVLPGGRGILFTVLPAGGALENAQVAVLDRETGTWTPLFRGGHHAHYVSSGHLVYAAQGTLRAVAFDLDRLSLRGTSALVVPRLVTTGSGAADFSVSTDGTLVYMDAPADVTNRTLVWVDRLGQEARLAAPPRAYQHPRLSADGGSVSLEITGQGSWVWDLQNNTLRRDEGGRQPISTPDGPHIVFGDGPNLFLRTADGAGTPVRLTESPNVQVPTSVTRGGQVVFHEITQTQGRDILMVRGEPGAAVEPLLATPADERNGMVSPDGRWLAYESDRSGRFEVWVGPFPNVADRRWQVSTDGGRHPAWSHDGRELFFVTLDGLLMAVPVDPREAVWNAGTPQRLFDRRYYTGGGIPRQYDVLPDGTRFLMLAQGTGDRAVAPLQVIVVQHWLDELRRRAPLPE